MANCHWNDSEGAHKYHLVNWDSVSTLNDFAGPGIPNLRNLNICLLLASLEKQTSKQT